MQALSIPLPSHTQQPPRSKTLPRNAATPWLERRETATADSLGDLSHLATEMAFQRNRNIYAGGDPADYCYRVAAGVVRLCKETEDGRRQIAAFPSPGDLFGWTGERRHGYSAEAATNVTLLRWPRRMVEAAVATGPEVRSRLLSMLFEQLAEAQNHLLLLGQLHAHARVATFLLSCAQRCERDGIHSAHIPFQLRRGDIADYLGLTVETVSRTMSAFKRRGLLDFGRDESLHIRSREGLERIAADLMG